MTKEHLSGTSFFMPPDAGYGPRRPHLPVFAPDGGGSEGGSADEGGGADPDDDIPEAPVSVPTKERYREPTAYEKKLRSENQKLRQRALSAEQALKDASTGTKSEFEQKLAEARAAADAAVAAEKAERERLLAEAKTEAERGVSEARAAAEQRIIKAEVRAAAIAAGLVHTKGIDLLDLAEVKLDDVGNLVLPEDYFAKAKEEMPFLFAEQKTAADEGGKKPAANSSNPTQPPSATPPATKKGMEMTEVEWAAKRRELMSGRV